MFRVTGQVVRHSHKSGNKVDPVTGEVRSWQFDVVTVLVASQSIVEVARFGDCPARLPGVGESCDWAVGVSIRNGRLSVNLDNEWAKVGAQLVGSK